MADGKRVSRGRRERAAKAAAREAAARGQRMRAAFTLVEILVVLAITVILMGVLLIPLSRSLDLTQRASAKITGQDNVRAAMRTFASDLNNAMEVYEPRPINLFGYSTWTENRGTPTPT